MMSTTRHTAAVCQKGDTGKLRGKCCWQSEQWACGSPGQSDSQLTHWTTPPAPTSTVLTAPLAATGTQSACVPHCQCPAELGPGRSSTDNVANALLLLCTRCLAARMCCCLRMQVHSIIHSFGTTGHRWRLTTSTMRCFCFANHRALLAPRGPVSMHGTVPCMAAAKWGNAPGRPA